MKNKKEKQPPLTTCDGCSFEEVEGDETNPQFKCTRMKRQIDNYPVIPAWCPLPAVMGCAESLLSTLQDYIDASSDELLTHLQFYEEQEEKYSEGWLIADQRLYELDNIYEFIHRITETNVDKEKM
jgi:hypothetical protein